MWPPRTEAEQQTGILLGDLCAVKVIQEGAVADEREQ